MFQMAGVGNVAFKSYHTNSEYVYVLQEANCIYIMYVLQMELYEHIWSLLVLCLVLWATAVCGYAL
jgi:GMP synthase PP-ATPase subunit